MDALFLAPDEVLSSRKRAFMVLKQGSEQHEMACENRDVFKIPNVPQPRPDKPDEACVFHKFRASIELVCLTSKR